jgi:FtsP/CotA-like multicopper oxidase with cupredoxin domain
MKQRFEQPGRLLSALALGLALILPVSMSQAAHDIRGITGGTTAGQATFNLYAFPFNMNLPDGSSIHMWGFGDADAGANATHPDHPTDPTLPYGDGYGLPQYPAPTLIVNQGDQVTINLTNPNPGVPQPVSIVVTGHKVTATETVPGDGNDGGLVTEEASAGETVSYTFIAEQPGTYIYHSMAGPNPGLHAEMGLQGALIVRPTGFDAADPPTDPLNRRAYAQAGTDYDQEFLYLLTEVDPDLHFEIERGHYDHVTHSDRSAKIWFVNGRVFPDLFQGDYNSLFPHQPYQALAAAHPGDKVLVREVNAGSDSHPFHHHGENLRFIARDGRALSSDGLTADLGRSDNTLNSAPKQTVDMIWTWTGKDLNWDIYGSTQGPMGGPQYAHDCVDDDGDGFGDAAFGSTYEHEYCADHNKEFPVTLPGVQEMGLGGWWSGSPFLGDTGGLPPGEGGLNPFGGYFLVWHSHAEKELTTFDIFPGGSLSSVVVLPPGVPIQ